MKRKLLLAALALVGVTSASANVILNTDLTSDFSSLTELGNWTTPPGAESFNYTGTGYCPMVEVGGGIGYKQVIERYVSTCTETGSILKATVSGLTPATYTIELYGAAAYTFGRGFDSEAFTSDKTWTAGDKIEPTEQSTGVKLYATSNGKTYGGEIPIYYATNFPNGAATVTITDIIVGEDGTVEIGMEKTSKSTNWHVIQLKSVIATVDGDALLNTRKATAEELLKSDMNNTVKDALQTAHDATPEENEEAYLKAISDLDAAIADAQASIAVYAKVKAQLDIYLDENGRAAYTNSDAYKQLSEAYNDGSLEDFSTEQETALAEALCEAAKQQTTDGANFTYAIINPGFETGNTNGWTGEINGIMTTDEPVKVGNYFVESYDGTGFDGTKSIKQTISNMPAGSYRLTANVISRGTSSVKVFAGDAKADAFIYTGDKDARRCAVEFTLDDTQDLTIGVEAEGSGTNVGYDAWIGVDDFTLELVKSVKVTVVEEAGYATFSSGYALDLTTVDAYIVTKPTEGETITLDPCKGIVPANTGLIIAGNGEVKIPIASANAETIDVEDNLLVATDGGIVDKDNYVLAAQKNTYEEVGFYVLEGPMEIEAGKAYLKADAVSAANPAKAIRIVFGDDNATAIEAVATEAEADGAIYNVAGQQVGKDYKGIVIKNGKKYLNK